MSKEATIKLGEREFKIFPFNLDELEQVGEIIDGQKGTRQAIKILKLALCRAEPHIDDTGTIEASPQEVNEAISVILKLAGMEAANPQTAAARAAI